MGCERFFNLSGYISSPKRTSLGVRTYERLAMLSNLIQNVYVNEERIAEEYLRRDVRVVVGNIATQKML